jgi:hypothetical protein
MNLSCVWEMMRRGRYEPQLCMGNDDEEGEIRTSVMHTFCAGSEYYISPQHHSTTAPQHHSTSVLLVGVTQSAGGLTERAVRQFGFYHYAWLLSVHPAAA